MTPTTRYRRTLTGLLSILGTAIVLGGCTPRVSDKSIRPVSVAEVAKWTERDTKRVVVDVRHADEFAAGHIPGARNLTLPALEQSSTQAELKKMTTVVICGEDGGSARAIAASKRLIAAGFGDVRTLEGGYFEWRRRGLPVATGAQ